MWDKTALFCQFTGGPDPLEIKMTPEEDMGRDPQQVQFHAMYVALATTEIGRNFPAERPSSLLPISCRCWKQL